MKSYDKVQNIWLMNGWLRNYIKVKLIAKLTKLVLFYRCLMKLIHIQLLLIRYIIIKNFVPETNYQQQEMTFKQLLSIEDIEKDGKGIYHSISPVGTTNKMDLIVVPGVAFDKLGYRIGYGGGYYDRFLSQHRSNTVSLLYDFQLAQFNIEPHDQPVEQLIIYHNKVVEE